MGQAAYGSRRVSVWITPLFSVFKLSFTALFGIFDSGEHLVAVGRFCTTHVIFRSQGFKNFLHLMAIFGPVVISLVQNQPKLETWVGAADVDAASFAERHRFVETRMLVSVEYRPDLIVFLERILFPATAWVESQRSCEFDGIFCDGVGNAYSRVSFYFY